MHSVTSSIAVSSLINQPWISTSNKAKILEYKGRLDLLQYASRGCPKLLIGEIENYVPKVKEASSWDDIFERVNMIDDDGHAAKLVRALAHGQRICAMWEKSEGFRIKDGMWLQLGNMGRYFHVRPAWRIFAKIFELSTRLKTLALAGFATLGLTKLGKGRSLSVVCVVFMISLIDKQLRRSRWCKIIN